MCIRDRCNSISEVYLNAVASLYTYVGGYSDSQGLQGTCLLYTSLCCCSMAYAQSNDNSEVVLLHTGWEFSQAGTELWRTAEVPGTVPVSYTHLDVYKRQGHSAAFIRTFRHDMQSHEGMNEMKQEIETEPEKKE